MKDHVLTGVVTLLLVIGCGPSTSETDGGAVDAAADGSAPRTCEADRDCGGSEELYCTRMQCRPGEPGADERGCVDLGPPCAPGEGCDEELDRCGAPAWCRDGREGCMMPGDCDGDGHPARECGGDDCDDDDGLRFPGNTEVCDAAGHDEDCDPDTFARASDGDRDGDGFTDAACCNGTACGDDCDDDDVNRNPAATESCDGVDNDCDGAIDVSAAPLCPGGVCYGGRCNLMAWDRTFGDTGIDGVNGVAIDDAGNVYVAGKFSQTADFGGGPVAAVGPLDLAVVSYTPDGVFRWRTSLPLPGTEQAEKIGVDSSGVVYALIRWEGSEPISFGGDTHAPTSGEQQTLLALRADDGSYLWDRRLTTLLDIAAVDSNGVVAVGFTSGGDFGGGVRGRGSYLVRYDSSGGWEWDTVIEDSVSLGFNAVATHGEAVVVVGFYEDPVDLGGGTLPLGGDEDIFVASFGSSSGEHVWSVGLAYPSRQLPVDIEVSADGQVTIAGIFVDGLRLSSEVTRMTATPGDVAGFIAAYSDGGGYLWDRVVPSSVSVNSMARDADGNLFAVGSFSGAVNFGGGLRAAAASASAFVVSYGTDGHHRWDRVFGMAGSNHVYEVVAGPANSVVLGGSFFGSVDFGSGPRTSAGQSDGFVFGLSR